MSGAWAVESAQLSDTGQKRRHNEDYVGLFEPDSPNELAAAGRLYLVADGVGGAASGEIASQYAVQKVLYQYYATNHTNLEQRLLQAIANANADIFGRNHHYPEHREMATTLVGALLFNNSLIVANIGDSRAYLVRDSQIEQISRDHSLVQQLVDEGSITPTQAESHPARNRILRSLGIDDVARIDTFRRQLQPGDAVVLCTDGLTRHVTGPEIAQTVTGYPPRQAAFHLVEMANMRGGKDNISVSITKILPQSTVEESPAKTQPLIAPHWKTPPPAGKLNRPAPAPGSPRRKFIGLAIILALTCLTAAIGATFVILKPAPPPPITAPSDLPTAALLQFLAETTVPAIIPIQSAPEEILPASLPALPSAVPAPPTPVDCLAPNKLQFQSDVTIPAGMVMHSGISFVKAWQVLNTGQCPWTPAHHLSFVQGDLLPFGPAIPLPHTQVGASTVISLALIAPAAPGDYTGLWQLQTPTGQMVGDTLSVKITVLQPD